MSHQPSLICACAAGQREKYDEAVENHLLRAAFLAPQRKPVVKPPLRPKQRAPQGKLNYEPAVSVA
jgi:hypothetical protein